MTDPRQPELSPRASLALDAIRLLAAQMVLLGHAFDFFDWNSSLLDPGQAQIQRLGVVVFFLLSGFLIPYSVSVKTHSLKLGYRFADYFVDRVSRIYCGLVPALIFIALADALPFEAFELDYPVATDNTGPLIALANALHLQEYPLFSFLASPIPIFGSGDPLWSLSVEWWIYMLFGVWTFRATSLGALVLAAIAIPSVIHNLVGGTGDGIAIAWLMGWLGFVVWRRLAVLRFARRSGATAMATAVALSLLAVGAVWRWPEQSRFGFDPVFAAFALTAMISLLIGLGKPRQAAEEQGEASGRSRLARFVRAAAGSSFTLYLTHFSLLTLLYELKGQFHPALLVAFAVVLSNVTAHLVSLAGERHTPLIRCWLRARIPAS